MRPINCHTRLHDASDIALYIAYERHQDIQYICHLSAGTARSHAREPLGVFTSVNTILPWTLWRGFTFCRILSFRTVASWLQLTLCCRWPSYGLHKPGTGPVS